MKKKATAIAKKILSGLGIGGSSKKEGEQVDEEEQEAVVEEVAAVAEDIVRRGSHPSIY